MRAVVIAVALCAGCLADRYVCHDRTECVRDGQQGTCEATGFCSFADSACDSGMRYGEHADEAHRDACVALGCVRDVVAGALHSCAVTGTGEVWCWGDNGQGQLGNGSLVGSAVPTRVVDDRGAAFGGVTSVAAGGVATCAVRADRTAWCWGSGARTPMQIATSAGALTDVAQLAVGALHACAVRGDGSAWCWGDNANGELGDGSMMASAVAVAVRGADGALTNVARVAAGAGFTCAVRGAQVWCWGDNEFAQLGVPDSGMMQSATPVIALPMMASALAAGGAHACAIARDGAVWCWGRADDGQIGALGLPGVGVAATQVIAMGAPLAGATGVAAGGAHSCASVDGGVRCWGAAEDGEIGDGAMTRADTAVSVRDGGGAPVANMLGVAAGIGDYHGVGARHSCARQRDAVWCWGAGGEGQLGDAGMMSRASAVPVRMTEMCGE